MDLDLHQNTHVQFSLFKVDHEHSVHAGVFTSSPPGKLTDDSIRIESSLVLVSTFQRR